MKTSKLKYKLNTISCLFVELSDYSPIIIYKF